MYLSQDRLGLADVSTALFIYSFHFQILFFVPFLFLKCYICDAVSCSNAYGAVVGERVISEY